MKKLWILFSLILLFHNIIQWNYANRGQDWGDYFPLCESGNKQSPIDFEEVEEIPSEEETENFPNITISAFYASRIQHIFASIINESIAISFTNDGSDGYLIVQDLPNTDGEIQYNLEKMIIHYQSEHTVAGNNYPIEIQFYHTLDKDSRETNLNSQLVISVFFNEITDEIYASQFIYSLRLDGFKQIVNFRMSNIIDYLGLSAYFYEGSETCPACRENVYWFVFVSPLNISKSQLEIIRKIITDINPKGNTRTITSESIGSLRKRNLEGSSVQATQYYIILNSVRSQLAFYAYVCIIALLIFVMGYIVFENAKHRKG